MQKSTLISIGLHAGVVLLIGTMAHYRAESPQIVQYQLSNVVVRSEESESKSANRKLPTGTAVEPAIAAREDSLDSTATSTTASAEASTSGLINSRYLQELRSLIASRKFIPRSSILKEEQGTVTVKLSLDGQGKLTSAIVTRSSGFSTLDEAAMKTLRQIDHFPMPAPGMRGLELLVPIQYELK